MQSYLLAIDAGTTSIRAMLFDHSAQLIHCTQKTLNQYFPDDGWVEHDPEEIWQTTLSLCRQVISESAIQSKQIASIGITNQRETTLIWDRQTHKAIYPAIVWQDRRTESYCQAIRKGRFESEITHKTGLLIDPYFSATKIQWLLDNIDNARELAENGRLAFGTIDSFLLWRFTGGKQHATDATNASRTLLYNIRTNQWDNEILEQLTIPVSLLPEVKDSSDNFGVTDTELFGHAISINGIAGDQQSAAIGQACFHPGMLKSTYGTGCFMLFNTGNHIVTSKHKLLSTIAYRINHQTSYAIEGSIFNAGSTVQWLKDNLNCFSHIDEIEPMLSSINDNGGLTFIPAFTGLGAPFWDAKARGAIFGLTRNSNIAHIVRAAIESIAYQTKDLVQAMIDDGADHPSQLRVDGGMVNNNWLCQFLADILSVEVERPRFTETTALGVAFLAGLHIGMFSSLDELSQVWQKERSFNSKLNRQHANSLYQGWLAAINHVKITP